jgi:hypothetical protein
MADKKQFSNTNLIVKEETGIVTLINKATKVYLSLHIWKEHVEIDQITNFHEKIIWQSQLYRIPLTAWLKQHRKTRSYDNFVQR